MQDRAEVLGGVSGGPERAVQGEPVHQGVQPVGLGRDVAPGAAGRLTDRPAGTRQPPSQYFLAMENADSPTFLPSSRA